MTISLILSWVLMGLALAADASSVSLVYGGSFKPFKWRHAAIPAAAFGFAQAAMPAIGWASGELIYQFVQAWGHWIAFAILLIVGGKFILDSRHENDAEIKDILQPLPLFLSAFATSIDACAVGFTLAMEEQPIVVPALIFGFVTFLCSMFCCYLGSKIGEKLGPKLLLVGGIMLILIGVKILISGIFEGLLPF